MIIICLAQVIIWVKEATRVQEHIWID